MRASGIVVCVRLFYIAQNALILVVLLSCSTSIATKRYAPSFKSHTPQAPSHVFIFGLGYTGLALASSIKNQFPNCIVSGTCRSEDKAENLRKFGIRTFVFDPDVRFHQIPTKVDRVSQICWREHLPEYSYHIFLLCWKNLSVFFKAFHQDIVLFVVSLTSPLVSMSE